MPSAASRDAGTIRAALFDVDGTLVDSNYLHVVAWWDALAQAGHDVPMAAIHRAVGMGSDHLLDALLPNDRPTELDDGIRAAHGALYLTYRDRLKPLAGAAELLRACRRSGLKVVLATSAGAGELAMMLQALAADDAIDQVASADDARSTKPAPDLVQVALRKADVGPDQAVFVGDSVWDVQACERAGVACIGLRCGGTSAGELSAAGAVAVYGDPADLLTITAGKLAEAIR